MLVHCFTVRGLYDNPFSCDSSGNPPIFIETVYSEFGINIPKYLQYEGGCGNTYLCCDTLYQIEVEEDKYNNTYTIYPTYSRDGAKFVLK